MYPAVSFLNNSVVVVIMRLSIFSTIMPRVIYLFVSSYTQDHIRYLVMQKDNYKKKIQPRLPISQNTVLGVVILQHKTFYIQIMWLKYS